MNQTCDKLEVSFKFQTQDHLIRLDAFEYDQNCPLNISLICTKHPVKINFQRIQFLKVCALKCKAEIIILKLILLLLDCSNSLIVL